MIRCRMFGHRDKPIAVQSPTGFVVLAGPTTIVLCACQRCQRRESYFISGTWTLSDILRDEPELTELERMAKL